jgi:L-ascorbate metabolism protein UlaG (beta-lactamase superfamily)
MNLPPITETADLVIRSSDDDNAHCYVGTIPGSFCVVTATDIVETGITEKDLSIEAIWSQESLIHKEVARDNAIYRFTLDGINITHMGDVGNPLSAAQMDALAGTDVLLALTGGPPTIPLDDLKKVIETIEPKVVIPMHYRIPGPRFFMLPVTDFTALFPSDSVTLLNRSEIELGKDELPEKTHIFVLEPTYVGDTE